MKNIKNLLAIIAVLTLVSGITIAQSIDVKSDEIVIESGQGSDIKINAQWGSFNNYAYENGTQYFNTIRTFPTLSNTKCYIINRNSSDQFYIKGK